jgi:hypothetical protein
LIPGGTCVQGFLFTDHHLQPKEKLWECEDYQLTHPTASKPTLRCRFRILTGTPHLRKVFYRWKKARKVKSPYQEAPDQAIYQILINAEPRHKSTFPVVGTTDITPLNIIWPWHDRS